MRIGPTCFVVAVGAALAGCALEPAGPSPYDYTAAPYGAPGGFSYWSSPYYDPYAPYTPYGYPGTTLGFGFGGERWHERDRDWHRRDRDRDWHREGAAEGHHRAEHSSPGSVAAAPPSHAAPPPTHAAPPHLAPPNANWRKEPPPPLHGLPY
jgi:hypothetical protein